MFFDISFGELFIIGAVGLIVIGPEKLPKVARTAGMLFGRAQRMASGLRADLERELHLAEMAELKQKISDEAANFNDEMADSAAQLSAAFATPETEPENRILPESAAETAPESAQALPDTAKPARKRRKPAAKAEPAAEQAAQESRETDTDPAAKIAAEPPSEQPQPPVAEAVNPADAAPVEPKKAPRKRKVQAEQIDLFAEPPAESDSTDWGDRR